MDIAETKKPGENKEKEAFYELVEAAINGDQQAFAEIYRLRMRLILHRARFYLKDEQDAQDAAQNAVLQMYQYIAELEQPRKFDYWMYRIIKNECYMTMRKKVTKKSHLTIKDYEESAVETRLEFLPEEYIESCEKREMLREIIDSLPMQRREATYLYYYSEMSHAEIAYVMGISSKTQSLTLCEANCPDQSTTKRFIFEHPGEKESQLF